MITKRTTWITLLIVVLVITVVAFSLSTQQDADQVPDDIKFEECFSKFNAGIYNTFVKYEKGVTEEAALDLLEKYGLEETFSIEVYFPEGVTEQEKQSFLSNEIIVDSYPKEDGFIVSFKTTQTEAENLIKSYNAEIRNKFYLDFYGAAGYGRHNLDILTEDEAKKLCSMLNEPEVTEVEFLHYDDVIREN